MARMRDYGTCARDRPAAPRTRGTAPKERTMARDTSRWTGSEYAADATASDAPDYGTVTVPDATSARDLYRNRDSKDLATLRTVEGCGRCAPAVARVLAHGCDPSGSHLVEDGSAADDGTLVVESLATNNLRGRRPVDLATVRPDARFGNIRNIDPRLVKADKALVAATRQNLADLLAALRRN